MLIGILLCAWIHLPAQYLTYVSDIKPILERHCVKCHTEGEVGAMPLTTYEEVSSYGKMIQYVTSSRLMPPWYADPTYSHFANERLLSADEIEKISHWVEDDMHEGALPYGMTYSKSVAVNVVPRLPDVVLPMQEAFEQYGVYLDQYQVFVIPTRLDNDQWIEGIEFVPGNKKIVRAASISLAPHSQFDSLDRWDPRYGYYSFGGLGKSPSFPYWYTWSPQQKLSWWTEGRAKFLPKNSDLLVHIHYGPTGKPQKDSSMVRLWFTSKKINQPIISVPLINPYVLTNDSFYIAANTKQIFHARYTVPYDIQLLSLTPQANLICRSWEMYALIPDQRDPVKLLKINDWNFNWKQTYRFASPVILPKGSVVHCLAQYDNTLENPCNPSDRPVDIGWGAHIFNELLFVHAEMMFADTSLPVQLQIPVVVSSNSMAFTLDSPMKSRVSFYLTDAFGNTQSILRKYKMRRGPSTLSIPLGVLSNGNYLLEVRGKKEELLGCQIFIKMKTNGM